MVRWTKTHRLLLFIAQVVSVFGTSKPHSLDMLSIYDGLEIVPNEML